MDDHMNAMIGVDSFSRIWWW